MVLYSHLTKPSQVCYRYIRKHMFLPQPPAQAGGERGLAIQ